MKKLIFILAVIVLSCQGYSQKTNLIFFTEKGERFYLVLNGIQQNAEPQTNVLVTDLPAPSYKLKIIFEDTNLGEIDKNLMFQQGTESTFNIKKNNKNEWVVRFLNSVPLTQAPPPAAEQYVIVYRTTPPPPPPPPTSVVIVTQTTTTGTTTTTTSAIVTPGITAVPAVQEEEPAYILPGYNGPVGCDWPMMPEQFNEVKNSIDSKTFEESKLTIAKQVIGSNCLTCSQVKEIMLLFTYEDTKLDFAKFAYGYTYDIGNYYRLNDAFTYESSIEELNEYINTYKH